MEFNKPMDVSSFDWDDTELVKAYDRVMKAKKSKSKRSKANKENAKEGKTEKLWNVGDYCSAPYQEDGLSYEAIIVDIEGDSCTVEFLGYGNYEEVSLEHLGVSLGKKARQKQRKMKKALRSICTTDTDCTAIDNLKDVKKAVKSGHHVNGNTTVEQCDYFAAGYAQQCPQAGMQQLPVPPQLNFNHAPSISAPVQRMGGIAHCLVPPPAPPVPPCSATANDPQLSAMLVAWYMAGYYTGLNQNQKSCHCPAIPKTHCCNHCGHFF